ncbi:hypothetical protein PHYBOEH_010642 [Phytophthora boehmeriae]|uniref:Peroxisomal biogenesis factor 11 n=1 Tax=Phytophthora boehmeriae TaxID=109152 RepID=A0A8T1WX41_9STRA|nr:hypothetical protein PHYBOEH_010642 [Phytophthora boehmeriae]
MRLNDDALARAVFFLSTTESRSKLYRLLQYSAKFSRWSLLQLWELDPKASKHTESKSRQLQLQSKTRADWRYWIVASLSRAELVFGDARRLFRFLQFLEMADLYRQVQEPMRAVRVLRRLRILCFFFFYLTENYVVLHTRVLGVSPREPRMRRLRRSCNGFWLLSILLAFPLDHMMHRGTLLSTAKKFLDLPVAYIGLSGVRVSDGLFGALGLASAQIGVVSCWLDAMTKFQQQHSKRLAADVA